MRAVERPGRAAGGGEKVGGAPHCVGAGDEYVVVVGTLLQTSDKRHDRTLDDPAVRHDERCPAIGGPANAELLERYRPVGSWRGGGDCIVSTVRTEYFLPR